MSDQSLTTVDFHGATLFAIRRPDGVFLAIGPICDDLGIAVAMQRKRIKGDPILSEGGIVAILPSPGGAQETFCLRLDLVHGWLFTIDESRVNLAARERVLLYKRECYRVLFDHFTPNKANAATVKVGEIVIPEDLSSMPISGKMDMVDCYRRIWGIPAAQELTVHLRMPIMPSMEAAMRQRCLDYPVHGESREVMEFRPRPAEPGGAM